MNSAWSAIPENVEKNDWMLVLAPAIAPARNVNWPRVKAPSTVS